MKKFNNYRVITALLTFAFTFVLAAPINVLAATSPTLGTVGSYSVLGHTTVTNTGNTTMPGDLGISTGGAPTGFPSGLVVGPPGTIRNAADSLAAQNADTAAFLALSAAPNVTCDASDPAIATGLSVVELGGKTLTPGVYCADAFQLSGTLTLNAQGNPNAVWIFRAELSTLITSTGDGDGGGVATVEFLDGIGSSCNVWWKVASSATLGTDSVFIGNILASTSIALQTRASLDGRALAQTGAVTLDNNRITGRACLTAASFSSSTSVPGNSPSVLGSSSSATVVPKLPNTGYAPSNKRNDSSNIIVPAVAFAVLASSYLVRRKWAF